MICSKCDQKRPAKQFAPDAKTRTGRSAWCKPCKKELQKAYAKARRAEPEYKPGSSSTAAWYGLIEADYEQMLALQGGVCAGCNRPPKDDRRLNIDHKHQPGDKKREPFERADKVRGLLCHVCNRTLGFLRDNIVALRNLAAYLDHPPANDVVRPKYERLMQQLDPDTRK
jgi:hypothetical protein